MSKFKKITVACLVSMVLLLQAGLSLAQPLDVEGHWAQEQILEWLDKGWTQCSDDGKFYPDDKITRGEFVALTNKAFSFTESTQINFSDLAEDHQYAEEIAKAVAAGYISGFGDGTVRPDEYISRLEVAAILVKITELPLAEDSTLLTSFKDYEDIPVWGRGFVGAAVDVGLLKGYPDSSFRPQAQITRAEAINVLDNAIDVLDISTDNITNTGYVDIEPSAVDSGTLKNIMIFYFLGEDFTEGSVIFYLPPEITATEYKDTVVVSDSSGKATTFELEPHHIVNGGKEVHITGITAAEGGVVILLLKDRVIPDPGYYIFSVSADADGDGEKLATEDEQTAELFSRVPLEYEGILEVSPKSAKSGTNQTLTLTYTLGDDFDEGWIEFSLPEEMTVTVGQDKVVVNGVEKILDKADVSDDGQKVYLEGITAKKGNKVTLTIYDKTIPEVGPYYFKVKADADGKKEIKPATLGAGSEFIAFLAYSQIEENKDIIDSFIKAINLGDVEITIDLLADDAVYVNNYMDGYFEIYKSKEAIAEYINTMVAYGATLENKESTLIELSENVWQVEGKANDYGTILTSELNPDEGFEGLGYTAKFFVTDKKVCYVEFIWNREEEILMDKLNKGAIGIFMVQNKRGEAVILACVPGMPAEKAGLVPGDIVEAVNGIKIDEMESYGEARFRMLGKVGTKVILTINRNGEIFDVELERAVY